MLIEVAVVEDSLKDRRQIVDLLNSCSLDAHILHIRSFSSGCDFLEAAESESFDIAFLDMCMPDLSGLETARLLRKTDRGMLLVFLTCTTDALQDGYTVRAFRYLLKPARRELLQECMVDAAAELAFSAHERIELRVGSKRHFLPADEILFVRADGNYTLVTTCSDTYRIRERLRSFAARLPGSFIQIHRSDIVNVLHVSALKPQEVLMRDGTHLSVSRTYRQKLQERFAVFH